MADDRPTVTVYVTCHNYARFLAECLDSVFAQSLPNWELLIFDDGSTDDSRAIAEEYVTRSPSRVRLFSTEAPRGLRSCANDAKRCSTPPPLRRWRCCTCRRWCPSVFMRPGIRTERGFVP